MLSAALKDAPRPPHPPPHPRLRQRQLCGTAGSLAGGPACPCTRHVHGRPRVRGRPLTLCTCRFQSLGKYLLIFCSKSMNMNSLSKRTGRALAPQGPSRDRQLVLHQQGGSLGLPQAVRGAGEGAIWGCPPANKSTVVSMQTA